MNKFLLVSACLGWIAFSCPPLMAEPSQALEPKGPLVKLPQGNFSCTVAVTPHVIRKPDPAHPEWRYSPVVKKIVITKVGNIRRDTIVWSDNTLTQLWNITDKGVSLEEKMFGARKNIYVLLGDLRDQACPPLLHFDAESVSWITEKAQGADSNPDTAFHYQANMVLPSIPPSPPRNVLYQAWIDPKTLLPLKFDDGDALYVLTFSGDAPTGPLVLPGDVQTELAHWQNAVGPHPHL